MWTSAELKERAKKVLGKYYWTAFLVSVVAAIFGGAQVCGNPSFSFSSNAQNRLSTGGDYSLNGFINYFNFDFSSAGLFGYLLNLLFGFMAISGALLILFVCSYGFRILVGGPMETGLNRYLLEARQDRSDFGNLFYGFRNGRYWNVVKVTAWRELFTFLWSLLLLIPGIVKSYAYSMIPFLLVDNPQMDYRRAMKLSIAMTDGEKFNIFVLQLSFLGWNLLGLLACCVGVIFVMPYQFATMAELYAVLRQNAIDKGLCTADEVGQQLLIVTQ